MGDAEDLQVEELRICKRVLGAEHPEALASMNNLSLYMESDRTQDERSSVNG